MGNRELTKGNTMSTEDDRKFTRCLTAQLFGVSQPTLLKWERQGLFVAFRDADGHPYYTAEQLQAFKRPPRRPRALTQDEIEMYRQKLGISKPVYRS